MNTFLYTNLSISYLCDVVFDAAEMASWGEILLDTPDGPFTLSLVIENKVFNDVIAYFYEHVFTRLTRCTHGCIFVINSVRKNQKRVRQSSISSQTIYLLTRMIESPHILHTYIVNRDALHPKTSSLPNGFDHQRNLCGSPDVYLKYADERSPTSTRQVRVFFMCRIRKGTFWVEQRRIRTLCETAWSEFAQVLPTGNSWSMVHVDQITALNRFAFSICAGTEIGPDVFECLAMGCIPIVKHGVLDDAYNGLPVVYVDEWTPDALSAETLRERQLELAPYFDDSTVYETWSHMLRTSYWVEAIRSRFVT